MTDEEVVKQKFPNAEISWGRYGAVILRSIIPKPKHWWENAYQCLSGRHTFASEAWADAAKRIQEQGPDQ